MKRYQDYVISTKSQVSNALRVSKSQILFFERKRDYPIYRGERYDANTQRIMKVNFAWMYQLRCLYQKSGGVTLISFFIKKETDIISTPDSHCLIMNVEINHESFYSISINKSEFINFFLSIHSNH